MAAIFAVAIMAMLVGCCSGCSCGESTNSQGSTELNAGYTKYVGAQHNTHVYDFTHDGTHYRSFTVASSGTFVINVTLDSLREREIEQNLQ